MKLSNILKCATVASLSLCAIAGPGSVLAEVDWSAVTIDNDSFLGNDNGYSSGVYYSWYDTPENNKAEIGSLARAMKWSLSDRGPATAEFSIKSIGQAIVTPDDITLVDPPRPPDDLPYAGLLSYSDIWIKVYPRYAEKIGVTIGIVGEYSFAEHTQTFVHEITGSDEPEGWDTQLNDEIVFQFSRAQVWKSWTSSNGRSDILLGTNAALGTISSSVGLTAMYRYGRQLERNFATTLLVSTRASNPLATESGWYLFAGANARYLANQIFLDGNTFDNDGQESVEYDNEVIGVILGMAYSWQDFSLTFILSDLNVADGNLTDDYTQFGSLTFAWRHK